MGLSVGDAQTSRVAMARLESAVDCRNDRRVKLVIVLTLSLLSRICHSDDERSEEEESAFPCEEKQIPRRYAPRNDKFFKYSLTILDVPGSISPSAHRTANWPRQTIFG